MTMSDLTGGEDWPPSSLLFPPSKTLVNENNQILLQSYGAAPYRDAIGFVLLLCQGSVVKGC